MPDLRLGLLLELGGTVHTVETPGQWSARHRRAVHRAGLRPETTDTAVIWTWTVPLQLLEEDLRRTGWHKDVSSPGTLPYELLAEITGTRLAPELVVTLLRDVFRVRPEDVQVLVLSEDEESDDDYG